MAEVGCNALHSWCSRSNKNSCVIAHVHRAQADSNCYGAVFAAAVAKPQPLLVGMLAFHGLLVGEPTKTMLTNELNGLCGCDIFLWESAATKQKA